MKVLAANLAVGTAISFGWVLGIMLFIICFVHVWDCFDPSLSNDKRHFERPSVCSE